jgi:hypothetical protein
VLKNFFGGSEYFYSVNFTHKYNTTQIMAWKNTSLFSLKDLSKANNLANFAIAYLPWTNTGFFPQKDLAIGEHPSLLF